MKQVSAKDRAFDRERSHLRHKINELELALKDKDEQIALLNLEHEQTKQELAQIKDWNERLLEYMDIPDEKRKDLIAAQDALAAFVTIRSALQSIFSGH